MSVTLRPPPDELAVTDALMLELEEETLQLPGGGEPETDELFIG